MAFGLKRNELTAWKNRVLKGDIAFITHFWLDPRFPNAKTVTKVGCSDVEKLAQWGEKYGLKREWIHKRDQFPHFDLLGEKQKEILHKEGLKNQIDRFRL